MLILNVSILPTNRAGTNTNKHKKPGKINIKQEFKRVAA